MEEQPNFSTEFREAVNNHRMAGGDIESIELRECESDNNSGVEYSFRGNYIPIRPIIDAAAEMDDFAIEEMSFNDEREDPRLIVFLADLRSKQTCAAFV